MGGVAKAELAVQRQRGVVGFLGVHPAGGDLPAAEPVECVGDEVDAEALTLGARMHGQALEVTLVAGPAGDGVADHVR